MKFNKLYQMALVGIASLATAQSFAAVNVDRSLFVHDVATLNAADFTLDRVMNQLAAQMRAANPADPINGFQLFARMWDAQRPNGATPNMGVAQCTGSVNNFPAVCRPVEGNQAVDPTRFMFEYRPIALVNRFDLRDRTNLTDCGEYRIIFANTVTTRNFIIFEAEVPNPTPGVASGCAPIQRLWESMTTNNSAASRASILANFYFNGMPGSGVRPVIDVRNFNANSGQIRTNQFMTAPWLLKEYKAGVVNGRNLFLVVSVKSNPVGSLFNINNTDERAVGFRTSFAPNLHSLVGSNLANISLNVSTNLHNNGQSHAQGSTENNFFQHFQPSIGSAFDNAIRNRLTSLGSNLTVRQVINRASAMTCGGCHQPGFLGLNLANAVGPNQAWPNSLGFVHVNENPVNGIFPISPALTSLFLPARKADMESYLANQPAAAALLLNAAPLAEPSLKDLANPTTTAVVKAKRSG
jgi:hypothetical protein